MNSTKNIYYQATHTAPKGTLAFVLVGGIVMLSIIQQMKYQTDQLWLMELLSLTIIVVILAWILVFLRLRVIVTDSTIIAHFGTSKPRREYRFEDIKEVAATINPWWYGVGIRLMPSGGWLYNVAGNKSVELRFHKGHPFRIGTDQPENLLTALREKGVKVVES